MNKTILLAIMILIGGSISAQLDTAGFEIFRMETEDTTVLMKKYYLLLYKPGPNRSQSEEEVKKIQKGHLVNIKTMAEERVICMAGPFEDSPTYSGVLVFSVKDSNQIHQWMEKDPAVQSGRLTYEFHQWWSEIGASLH